jgi:hypothetical protein
LKMAAEEKSGDDYCDSSSESDKDEHCELILGRFISPKKASSLLKMAKDKKLMKLRCLKHHKRKHNLSDSLSERSKSSKDPLTSSKARFEEEKEPSDTISEIKSSSSLGTGLHISSASKTNLSVFDFPDDSPNSLVFPALMGSHVRTHRSHTLQPPKFRPPKSEDRMKSLLSMMIRQDKMDRESLTPSMSNPPEQKPQTKSELSSHHESAQHRLTASYSHHTNGDVFEFSPPMDPKPSPMEVRMYVCMYR